MEKYFRSSNTSAKHKTLSILLRFRFLTHFIIVPNSGTLTQGYLSPHSKNGVQYHSEPQNRKRHDLRKTAIDTWKKKA